jgi:hypothetical protein
MKPVAGVVALLPMSGDDSYVVSGDGSSSLLVVCGSVEIVMLFNVLP